MHAVITEWWTGLDADNKPSRHNVWIEGPLGPMRRIELERLGSMLSAGLGTNDHVRVRLARGADGETDVRIELELAGLIEVRRWRPSDGNLDRNCLHGGRTLAKERSPEVLAARSQDLATAKTDPETMLLGDMAPCTHALKTRRMELREQIEAIGLVGGDDSAQVSELNDLTAKIAALAVRNVTLNAERKAALLGIIDG